MDMTMELAFVEYCCLGDIVTFDLAYRRAFGLSQNDDDKRTGAAEVFTDHSQKHDESEPYKLLSTRRKTVMQRWIKYKDLFCQFLERRRQILKTPLDPVETPKRVNRKSPIKKAQKEIESIEPGFLQLSFKGFQLKPRNVPVEYGKFSMKSYTWKGTDVILKSIQQPNTDESEKHILTELLVNEVKCLLAIRHANVLLMMAAVVPTQEDNIFIAFEDISLGSLYMLNHTQRRKIPYQSCVIYMKQICSALHFLHQQRYVHTAISSHSIYVITDRLAKLSCFEFAVRVSDSMQVLEKKKKKLPFEDYRKLYFQWHAPESLADHIYIQKSDVYSLCLVIWEMFASTPPFQNCTREEVLQYYSLQDLDYFDIGNGSIPPPLDALLLKGLMFHLGHRKLKLNELLMQLNQMDVYNRVLCELKQCTSPLQKLIQNRHLEGSESQSDVTISSRRTCSHVSQFSSSRLLVKVKECVSTKRVETTDITHKRKLESTSRVLEEVDRKVDTKQVTKENDQKDQLQVLNCIKNTNQTQITDKSDFDASKVIAARQLLQLKDLYNSKIMANDNSNMQKFGITLCRKVDALKKSDFQHHSAEHNSRLQFAGKRLPYVEKGVSDSNHNFMMRRFLQNSSTIGSFMRNPHITNAEFVHNRTSSCTTERESVTGETPLWRSNSSPNIRLGGKSGPLSSLTKRRVFENSDNWSTTSCEVSGITVWKRNRKYHQFAMAMQPSASISSHALRLQPNTLKQKPAIKPASHSTSLADERPRLPSVVRIPVVDTRLSSELSDSIMKSQSLESQVNRRKFLKECREKFFNTTQDFVTTNKLQNMEIRFNGCSNTLEKPISPMQRDVNLHNLCSADYAKGVCSKTSVAQPGSTLYTAVRRNEDVIDVKVEEPEGPCQTEDIYFDDELHPEKELESHLKLSYGEQRNDDISSASDFSDDSGSDYCEYFSEDLMQDDVAQNVQFNDENLPT